MPHSYGEEYVDAGTGKRLSEIVETAVREGVQVLCEPHKGTLTY